MNPEDHGQGPSRLDFPRLFGRLNKKKDKDDDPERQRLNPEDASGPAAPPYTPREGGGNGFGRDPGYLIYIPYNQLPRWMTNPGGNAPQAPDTKVENRGRRWKTILKWLAFVIAIWALIHLFVANSGEREDDGSKNGPGHGPDHGPDDHQGDKGPSHGDPTHDNTDRDPARFPGDGVAVKCAIYDNWVKWYPLEGGRSGYKRYSTNTSFDVPVRDDVFAHLTGPAGVGSVQVTTHEGDEDTAKVTVETVVDVLSGKPIVDSEAWRYLHSSNVCLMRKDEENSGDLTNGEDFGVRDGIGIYTAKPEGVDGYSHLSFRVYLSLPAPKMEEGDLSKEAREAIDELARQFPELQINTTLAGSWLDAINSVLNGKSGIQVLDGLVRPKPSLHIDAPVGSVHIGDVNKTNLGHVGVKTDVGSVHFGHVVADDVRVWGPGTASGSVNGFVEVTKSLDVDISTGSINLDVSLAKSPGVDSPYRVKLHSKSGSVQLKYKDWADPDRVLVEETGTDTGSIHVRPHPVYQGTFHYTTNVGSINIHSPNSPIPDPLGKGRKRQMEVESSKGMFPRTVEGKVVWKGGDGKKGDLGKLDARTNTGSINIEF